MMDPGFRKAKDSLSYLFTRTRTSGGEHYMFFRNIRTINKESSHE
jgi:hypothetical protein